MKAPVAESTPVPPSIQEKNKAHELARSEEERRQREQEEAAERRRIQEEHQAEARRIYQERQQEQLKGLIVEQDNIPPPQALPAENKYEEPNEPNLYEVPSDVKRESESKSKRGSKEDMGDKKGSCLVM